MSVEGLKEQARRHEQKEEWKQALELYQRAMQRLSDEDQPDVGLYNRVGDLCIRLGLFEQATSHYEQAVSLYIEAELPNNAIAVCKKIIRHVPSRNSVYLTMGRVRAKQGFLTDARQSFLTYAERTQAAGGMDEALRALEELADLTPSDVDIRLSLAQQLQQHKREGEALDQLRAAYVTLVRSGESARAEAVADKAREIDPGVDLESALTAEPEPAFKPTSSFDEIAEVDSELGEIVVGADPQPATQGSSDASDTDFAQEWAVFSVSGDEEEAEALPGFGGGEEGGDEEPLPFLEPFGGQEEEEGEPLPMLSLEEEGDDDSGLLTAEAFGEREDRTLNDALGGTGELEVSVDLDIDEARAPAEAREAALEDAAFETRAAPSRTEELIAAGDLDRAERGLRELMDKEPSVLSHRQLLVEIAYRRGSPRAQAEAYVELARCLERNGSGEQATGVYRQVLQLDPENAAARAALALGDAPAAPTAASVASSEDYVDLGSLIFGDEEEEKTTRFTVAYEEPSGDEQADFARMLDQFKAKIAQNVAADDVQAHHDLGTAYKEMGLIDEAIREFQAALRASRNHLPTYELLGQCFLDNGQPEAAVKSLTRALNLPVNVEDEFLGIYYYLGRAYEAIGKTDSAVEFYDRVFSLDINFLDVTDRLRSLR
jgi:tetratricopeptide (TPR) repeat protein